MSAGVTELTDSTFDAQVVDVPGPVLVEFSTDWDGASMMMTSTLDEIAVEYASTLSVAKHNIDRYPVTPPRYDVRAVPTFLLFEQGNVVATRIGPESKGQFDEFLDSHL